MHKKRIKNKKINIYAKKCKNMLAIKFFMHYDIVKQKR